MYKLFRPLIFKLSKDPETAHNLALAFLKLGGAFPFVNVVEPLGNFQSPALEQKVFSLTFKNPIGLAAGFDKNAEVFKGLEALGFGHIEVGTLTRLPQSGNPRQRMFRLPADKALINRMGFNNLGVEEIKKNLQKLKNRKSILGVSLGKNKETPLEQAKEDYLYSFKELYNLADYFAINVSSPNTENLRQLQDKSYLEEIISSLTEFRLTQSLYKPILVKIAPDLSFDAVDELLEVCKEQKIDGIITANTTLNRENITTKINQAGGLSGVPVKVKATRIIQHIYKTMPSLPIVGVGGIFTAEDAYEKIKAGASLVQVYTGFVYEGPFMAKKINQGLAVMLERDGFKNISEAVGKG